jgi:hypothetical protein
VGDRRLDPVAGDLLCDRGLRSLRADGERALHGDQSPFGRVAVGPVFTRWGNAGVWVEIAGGLTVGSLLFIAVTVAAWRSKASGSSSPAAQVS